MCSFSRYLPVSSITSLVFGVKETGTIDSDFAWKDMRPSLFFNGKPLMSRSFGVCVSTTVYDRDLKFCIYIM